VNHLTDSEIITNVLAGNTAAYAVLVNRYRNMVFTLAYQIIVNREDAEEIAQDAFVKAFSALRFFKEQAKFSTWMYRIVVNTALNKKKLKKYVVIDITDAEEQEEYDHIFPLLQPLEKKEQQKFILLAIDSLQESERICITMYYLNELSVNEINELTDLTQANIKVLLHRGRKHLYDKLSTLLNVETENLR
jgi:RNA polymerase sigma-70 factor (ECF subfamily)